MNSARRHPHRTHRFASLLATGVALAVVTVLSGGCGEPVKDPFNAPSLSTSDASNLVPVVADFAGPGSSVESDFGNERFQGFRIAAREGMVLSARVDRLSGDADPVLILYGPRSDSGIWGEARAVDDDGAGGVNPMLRVGPLAEGAYLFVVTAREADASGRFRLRVSCEAGCEGTTESTCALLDCDRDVCYGGFLRDESGCQTCDCLDECQVDDDCPSLGQICRLGECVETCTCDPRVESPVCGEDGVTYPNPCEATCAGVDVLSRGECAAVCEPVACEVFCEFGFARDERGCETCECLDPCQACTSVQEPVCSRTGRTYINRCRAACVGEIVAYAGECRTECPEVGCASDCPGGFLRDENGCPTCECVEISTTCDDTFRPLCGSDGVTYSSECEVAAAGVEILLDEACPPTCHVDSDCPTGYGCEAGLRGLPACEPSDPSCVAVCVQQRRRCDPTRITTDGAGAGTCESGEYCSEEGECVSSCGCNTIFYPVCGADGATYGNRCQASCAEVRVASTGSCCDVSAAVGCDLSCHDGFATDELGCDVCACLESPTVACTCDDTVVNRVCGADGNIYENECLMRCAGVRSAADDSACDDKSGEVDPAGPRGG
jgi:hypothetical protein